MPAKTRAVAPVRRLPVEESLGRTEEEEVLVGEGVGRLYALDFRAVLLATNWRSVLRDVKYRAEPKPVRRAEGRVPRHSEVIGCGELRMERRTGRREEERDCWTRVLSRSAGCRRTAEETPEVKPARK